MKRRLFLAILIAMVSSVLSVTVLNAVFGEEYRFLSVLVTCALAVYLAGVLSGRVVRSLQDLDPHHPEAIKTYEELAPLLRRLQTQSETIRIQKEALAHHQEDRETLRREFSANVSHELKTPLTSISGFAELLKGGMVPPETVPAWQEEIRAQAVFSPQDAELIEVLNFSGYEPDITDLLQKPLSWELTGEGPTVLILHTHATEGYKDTEGYRSEDTLCNMVSVGQRLAELLEEAGVGVIHDTMLHDQPSYSGAYEHARSAVQEYLARYPTIRLVLDLHRDAIADGNGTQLAYTLQTPKGNAARMMLVMGSGSGGLSYPNWQENLSLAVKLQAQLEKTTPGICRPIGLRASRYNQDLSPGALLIEMGAAGNTRQEALLSAEFLADAIIDLAYGAKGMQNAYMHSLQ